MLPRVAVASLVVALIAAPAVAQPQSPSQFGIIRGQVVEARTGAPLVAVLVQVQSTRQRAFSDADGRFEIPDVPAGSQTLVVSVVGFGLVRREVMVTSGQTSDLTIPVAGGASTYVEEVTVAASTFPEAEPAVSSQSVLGSRELLALRGVMADDPFRAVQTLPGVTTGDDFKGEFAVRGLGPQHVGIAVDGVDSPFLFHTVRAVDDTGSVALINSDILDQAVLLAGPHPQKLGSHLGARLDFSTREGTRAGFAARTLISGSAATGLFEGPIGSGKKGSWLIAGRQSYIDWLLQRIDPDLVGSFGFTDVQGGVTYDLTPRQQLRVTFIGGRSLLQESEDSPSLNTLERGSSRTTIANARWRLTLSPKALLHQQLYVVHNKFENQVTDGRAREEGWDRDLTWRGSLDWRPSAAHAFDIGAQAQVLRARRVDRRFPSATTEVVNVDANIETTNAAGYVLVPLVALFVIRALAGCARGALATRGRDESFAVAAGGRRDRTGHAASRQCGRAVPVADSGSRALRQARRRACAGAGAQHGDRRRAAVWRQLARERERVLPGGRGPDPDQEQRGPPRRQSPHPADPRLR